MPEEIIQISVEELQSNPLQPRGLITSESIVELVDSIKEHGVLEPLVIAKTPAGYQIIAGERRWRAAKIAGLSTIPVIIKETTPRGMLEMALVENVQRTDLNALERAKAFTRLIEEFNLTNREISKRISKSPSFISNTLKLLTLPDALKDGLLSGLISEGHARALASIEDSRLMVEAYKIILKESGSVRHAEELARRMKHKAGQKAKSRIKPPHILSDETDKMRQEIEDSLAGDLPTKVKLVRTRAETRIFIVFKGNLIQTEERLQKLYKAIKKI
jgi:ParB family chromosome partitioning protein